MAATKSSHFIDGNRVLCVLHNVGPLSVSHPHNFTILAINFDLFIAKRTDELTGSNNFKADSQKFCLEQFEFPASATSRSIKRWILPNDLFFCDVIDYGVVKSWMQVDKSWDEISTFRFWVRQLCLHFVSRGWRSGEGWPDWRIWRISRISRESSGLSRLSRIAPGALSVRRAGGKIRMWFAPFAPPLIVIWLGVSLWKLPEKCREPFWKICESVSSAAMTNQATVRRAPVTVCRESLLIDDIFGSRQKYVYKLQIFHIDYCKVVYFESSYANVLM